MVTRRVSAGPSIAATSAGEVLNGSYVSAGVGPTGALAETASRDIMTTGSSGLNSGTLRAVAIRLVAGVTLTSATFVSGSQAAVTPTNWWFGLFDGSRVCLRLTADQTNTAWAANTPKTVAFSSTYTPTTSGVYYLGIMMAAATPISVVVQTASATLNAIVPIRAGNTSDTGLTTPPNLPFTAGAITASANIIYAYVS